MGKPSTLDRVLLLSEHIGQVEGTGGTEISQYLEERKTTCDSLSSDERNGKSPNRAGGKAWWRCRYGVVGPDGWSTRSTTELQN